MPHSIPVALPHAALPHRRCKESSDPDARVSRRPWSPRASQHSLLGVFVAMQLGELIFSSHFFVSLFLKPRGGMEPPHGSHSLAPLVQLV